MTTIEELTVEEFIDDIELYLFEHSIETLKITEEFNRLGKRDYIVHDFEIGIENDVVICSDKDEVFKSNYCVMMHFLKTCVKFINKVIVDGIPHAEIEFYDGHVTVEIAS